MERITQGFIDSTEHLLERDQTGLMRDLLVDLHPAGPSQYGSGVGAAWTAATLAGPVDALPTFLRRERRVEFYEVRYAMSA
jgi:hypothetical protein